MRNWIVYLTAFIWVAGRLAAAENPAGTTLYENDFDKAELGSIPDDFLVLNGEFAVKEAKGNRFLELPGAPLESYGVLFGPTEKEGVAVSARIYSESKGRRYPAFAVGLNGVVGYRLQISPAKRLLELYKGDNVVASMPYQWPTATWTRFALQVRKAGGTEWQVEGKVWKEGGQEPAEWMLHYKETAEPLPGQASIWGRPYSGKPILFDDLVVRRVTKAGS